jgi:hypothetical protein
MGQCTKKARDTEADGHQNMIITTGLCASQGQTDFCRDNHCPICSSPAWGNGQWHCYDEIAVRNKSLAKRYKLSQNASRFSRVSPKVRFSRCFDRKQSDPAQKSASFCGKMEETHDLENSAIIGHRGTDCKQNHSGCSALIAMQHQEIVSTSLKSEIAGRGHDSVIDVMSSSAFASHLGNEDASKSNFTMLFESHCPSLEGSEMCRSHVPNAPVLVARFAEGHDVLASKEDKSALRLGNHTGQPGCCSPLGQDALRDGTATAEIVVTQITPAPEKNEFTVRQC